MCMQVWRPDYVIAIHAFDAHVIVGAFGDLHQEYESCWCSVCQCVLACTQDI